MLLTALALCIAALAALAAIARAVPHRSATAARVALAAMVVVLAAANLLTASGVALAEVQVGTLTLRLALDPLASSFLLLMFLVLPCAERDPLVLAATGLLLLAGDSVVFVVATLLLGCATSLRAAAVSAVALALGFAVAASGGDFAALRAAPPTGGAAAAMLFLILLAAAALGRIAPVLAAYLVLRVLLDLCGSGQPLWWGVPLLLAGGLLASIAMLGAATAATLQGVAAMAPLQQLGLAAIAAGVALFARAADLPSVAAAALAAAWLATVCHLLCRTLLQLGADAVEAGAASRRLDRLGGLVHRMPLTTGCCALGLLAVTGLPPGLGFAASWLVLQALLSAARIGEFGLQLLVAITALLMAASLGLAALAAVRLLVTAFLGRPRTPRSAVADEAPRPVLLVMAGLAGVTGLLGAVPVLALLPATGWIRGSTSLTWLGLRTGAESPGYASLVLLVLVGAAGLAVWRIRRRRRDARPELAWSGGFAAPPPWLPFGDPATQYGAASFSASLDPPAILRTTADAATDRLGLWRDRAVRVVTRLVVP